PFEQFRKTMVRAKPAPLKAIRCTMNRCDRFSIESSQLIVVCIGGSDFFTRRTREQRSPPPAFGAIKRRDDLAILTTDRDGYARFLACEMQQDGDFGFDLFATAPIGPIDSQKVRVAQAALDLVGVVQPTVMETTAADCSKRIEGQHLFNKRARAEIRIRSGEHVGDL